MGRLGSRDAITTSARSWARDDRILAAALCVALVFYYLAFGVHTYADAEGGYDGNGILIGHDFIVFWTASALILDGNIADIYNAAEFDIWQQTLVGPPILPGSPNYVAGSAYPWLYPPTGLFPVLPLAAVPYYWAYALWSLATFALLVWAAFGSQWRNVSSLALLTAPAVFACILAGQNGMLTAALLVAGLRFLDSRPVMAGVLIGLLGFKPHLGMLVPIALLAAHQWRAFASATVTIAAVAGASVAAFGVETWTAYLESATGLYDGMLTAAGGSFLNVVTSPYMGARILGLNESLRMAVQIVFTLLAGLGVYTVFRHRAEVEPSLRNAVLLSAVLLASPFGYFYDLPAVAVAVLAGYREGLRNGFFVGERSALVLAWTLPLVIIAANPVGVPAGPIVLAALFVYLLARALGWLPSRGIAAADAT
jgi:hypothetical protein